jgi:hypothetical protein
LPSSGLDLPIYLVGLSFRQRIQAIVEAFTCMQEDLSAERKALRKQWAKRETQLERLMTSTVGMYGDLQGIAGGSLEEIDGLNAIALAPPPAEIQGNGPESGHVARPAIARPAPRRWARYYLRFVTVSTHV